MTKKFVLNFILSAICYVALGIALIVWPAASINVFCYVLGGVTAAYGLWQIYRFISHREERYATLSLMVGIVALALGICFFVKPELFVSILPFILGLYLIFDGVVKLQAAIDIKKEGYQKWGILLLLAVLMIFMSPFSPGSISATNTAMPSTRPTPSPSTVISLISISAIWFFVSIFPPSCRSLPGAILLFCRVFPAFYP